MTQFKTAFGKKPPVKAHVGEGSTVQQQFKESTDINNIMKKYEKDGVLLHVNRYQGAYGDFTVLPDFQTAMHKMMDAQDMFMTLPASIRKKFNNDPGEFVEFATDPENQDQLRELGLAPKVKPGEEPKQEQPKPAEQSPKGDKPKGEKSPADQSPS